MLTIAILTLTGCASGTVKTEAWRIDEATINEVKAKCITSFPPATGPTMEELWANKRLILARSRECSTAANILADKAENRVKVIE